MKITNIHQSFTEADFLKNINRENSFVPPQKGDREIAASLQISEDAQKHFEEDILHFDGINISSKETFLAGLRNFMTKQPNFLSGILSLELSNKFWKY